MPRRSSNTPVEDRARLAERRRLALEMKKAGATYDAIARQLGYANRGNAYRDIEAALKDIIREPAEAVIKLEIERLDALLVGIWTNAKAGNPALIDRVLRIMERRSRLLGLDAPTRQTITVISEDVVDAEIRRLEEQLEERARHTETESADAET